MNHSYDHSNLCVFLVAIWNVVGQISGITNIPISCSKYHQVIRGDIPIKIADRYEISDEKLQYMNPAMDVYNIMPGQQLCVGITRAFPAEKERDATTSAKPSDGTCDTSDIHSPASARQEKFTAALFVVCI